MTIAPTTGGALARERNRPCHRLPQCRRGEGADPAADPVPVRGRSGPEIHMGGSAISDSREEDGALSQAGKGMDHRHRKGRQRVAEQRPMCPCNHDKW